MMRILLILSVLAADEVIGTGSGSGNGSTKAAREGAVYNVSQLLDTLLEGYDRRLRPGYGGMGVYTSPLMIDVNINIRSMGPISEKDMDYQMDCYFRQSWVDQRLRFNGNGSTLKTLPVAVNVLDRLWKPDTHFFNGRKSYLHTVTSPNKLLRINRDGRILYSMRVTIKASCPMHLEKFPMDTQTCPLHFGSHGYGTNDVVYLWSHGNDKSIKMAPDMTLSQFDLIGFPHKNMTSSLPHRGQYSELSVRFTLRRHMGYFLINVYVPCSLLVILSWVSFWINREATADRIALGVMTVLTMTFLAMDTRGDLPKVSYSTAVDYFVGTCFAFVLATIIQFASVHFFTKFGSGEVPPESESEEEEEEVQQDKNGRSVYTVGTKRKSGGWGGRPNGGSSAYYDEAMYNFLRENCCTKFWNCVKGSAKYRDMKMRTSRSGGVNSVSNIDKSSRIMFPVTFMTFHIFYWALYLDKGGEDVLM